MTIVLTPAVEWELVRRAREQGTTPDLLADVYLRERLAVAENGKAASADDAPRTLAERLKGYVGVLHSSEHVPGGAQMSERTGDKFTKILQQRREQGRL
jgi:sulfur carrier protein ThiS